MAIVALFAVAGLLAILALRWLARDVPTAEERAYLWADHWWRAQVVERCRRE